MVLSNSSSAAGGVALLGYDPGGVVPVAGMVLAFLAGLCWAAYILASANLGQVVAGTEGDEIPGMMRMWNRAAANVVGIQKQPVAAVGDGAAKVMLGDSDNSRGGWNRMDAPPL